jgi:hypothetical protein
MGKVSFNVAPGKIDEWEMELKEKDKDESCRKVNHSLCIYPVLGTLYLHPFKDIWVMDYELP